MNELYTLVESIINQGSAEALNQVIASLNQNPGAVSNEYACGENVFYVLKRFVTASLARDPRIKENVLNAIKQVRNTVSNFAQVAKPAFQEFFLTATDMADCKAKQ